MQIQPYLMFNGRCEEAFEFYRNAIGAKIEFLMRFKEAPEQPPPGTLPPGSDNKVMHASLRVGDTLLMASDGTEHEGGEHKGFSLALQVRDAAEAKRCFDALVEGGQVTMPLGRTFWSPCFGMCVDRFGVAWMVNANE